MAPAQAQSTNATTLEEIAVEGAGRGSRAQGRDGETGRPPATGIVGQPPPAYPGGQVARGGQLGLLGNRDFIDTPFSVTNLTAQTIENQQARSIADVITNDPSVKPIYSDGGYYNSYLIRGFDAGVRNLAFQGLYGIAPFSFVSPEPYERVEIIKGPGLLLGSYPPDGALGGSINLVPKRATDEPITRITTFYSSVANFGTHLDVGRRFGVNNEWGLRFNGVYRNGATAIDHNEREVGLAHLALDYRGEAVRFSVDFGYQLDNLRGNRGGYLLLPGQPVPRAPSNASNAFQPWNRASDETIYGVARAEVDLSDNVTAYGAFGGQIYNSQLVTGTATLAGNGTANFGFSGIDFENRVMSGEVGLRGIFELLGVKHSWSVSAQKYGFPYDIGFGFAGPALVSNIYDPVFVPKPFVTTAKPTELAYTEGQSVGFADVMSIWDDRLQVIVGGRQQYVRQSFFGVTDQGENFSPAAAIIIKPLDNVSLYANYMQALSIGQTAPAGTANFGQSVPPAVTDQTEAGIKVDWGRFATTFAAFEINRPSAAINPLTNVFGLIGEQRNRGLEFNVFGEVLPGVRVLSGLTLLDPTLVKAADPTQIGNVAPGVPRSYAVLGVEYDLPFLPGVTAVSRTFFGGSTFVDAGNTQRVSGYTRCDFGLRYTFLRDGGKPVTLRADVLNALGARYWQTDTTGTLVQGTPRTVLLSATLDF